MTNAKSLGLNYFKVHWAIYSLAINLIIIWMQKYYKSGYQQADNLVLDDN